MMTEWSVPLLWGPKHARQRPLWNRTAGDREGNAILEDARRLSCDDRYKHLSDAELIRLAYWGASGEPDIVGRRAQGLME